MTGQHDIWTGWGGRVGISFLLEGSCSRESIVILYQEEEGGRQHILLQSTYPISTLQIHINTSHIQYINTHTNSDKMGGDDTSYLTEITLVVWEEWDALPLLFFRPWSSSDQPSRNEGTFTIHDGNCSWTWMELFFTLNLFIRQSAVAVSFRLTWNRSWFNVIQDIAFFKGVAPPFLPTYPGCDSCCGDL